MLIELGGKGGCLCEPAKKGELRCPLIIRPNSEDAISANLFGVLMVINPRWWLPDLLNKALGVQRFRRQVFRNFRIELWQKQRTYPRQHLKWNEGQTEVDVVITWDNPPTTVFIEMKFGANLSTKTTNNDGSNGFPSDQLIRNARVGLHECGWYDEELLFDFLPRDFVLILLTPSLGNRLVQEYRDPKRLRESIPHGDRLSQLPDSPFIGELSYRCVVDLLNSRKRFMTKLERTLVFQLDEYLQLKLSQLKPTNRHSHE